MTTRPEHSVDVARKLNKSLHLETIALGGLEAHVIRFGEPPFKFALKLGSVHWTKSGAQLLAAFPVEVAIQDGSVDTLASLSVLVRATYGISQELSDEQMAAIPDYLGIVGWMQVWPYVRAEIQGLSTKLGFPPLTLPVLLTGQTRHVPVISSDEAEPEQEGGQDSEEELPLN